MVLPHLGVDRGKGTREREQEGVTAERRQVPRVRGKKK